MADGKKDKPSGDKAEIARVFQENCRLQNQMNKALAPRSEQVDCSKLSPPRDTTLEQQKEFLGIRKRNVKAFEALNNTRS